MGNKNMSRCNECIEELPLEALISANTIFRTSIEGNEDSSGGWGDWLQSFVSEDDDGKNTEMEKLVSDEKAFRAWQPPLDYTIVTFSADLGQASLIIAGEDRRHGPTTSLLKIQWGGNLVFTKRMGSWEFSAVLSQCQIHRFVPEQSTTRKLLLPVSTKNAKHSISIQSQGDHIQAVVEMTPVQVHLDNFEWMETMAQYIIHACKQTKSTITRGRHPALNMALYKDFIWENYYDTLAFDPDLFGLKVSVETPVVYMNIGENHHLAIDWGNLAVATSQKVNYNDARYKLSTWSLTDMKVQILVYNDDPTKNDTEVLETITIVDHMSTQAEFHLVSKHVRHRITTDPVDFIHTSFPLLPTLLETLTDKVCPIWKIRIKQPACALTISPHVLRLIMNTVSDAIVRIQRSIESWESNTTELDDLDFASVGSEEDEFFDAHEQVEDTMLSMSMYHQANRRENKISSTSISTSNSSDPIPNMPISWVIMFENDRLSIEVHDIVQVHVEAVYVACWFSDMGYLVDGTLQSINIQNMKRGHPNEELFSATSGDKTGSFVQGRYFSVTSDEIYSNNDLNLTVGKTSLQWHPLLILDMMNEMQVITQAVATIPYTSDSLMDSVFGLLPMPTAVPTGRCTTISACVAVDELNVTLRMNNSTGQADSLAQFQLTGILCDYRYYNSGNAAECGRLNSFVPGLLTPSQMQALQEMWEADPFVDAYATKFFASIDTLKVLDLTPENTNIASPQRNILYVSQEDNTSAAQFSMGVFKTAYLQMHVEPLTLVLWCPFLVSLVEYMTRESMLVSIVQSVSTLLSNTVYSSDTPLVSNVSMDKRLGQVAQSVRENFCFVDVFIKAPALVIPLSSTSEESIHVPLESLSIWNAVQGLDGEWIQVNDGSNEDPSYDGIYPFVRFGCEAIVAGKSIKVFHSIPVDFLLPRHEFQQYHFSKPIESVPTACIHVLLDPTLDSINLSKEIYWKSRIFYDKNAKVAMDLVQERSSSVQSAQHILSTEDPLPLLCSILIDVDWKVKLAIGDLMTAQCDTFRSAFHLRKMGNTWLYTGDLAVGGFCLENNRAARPVLCFSNTTSDPSQQCLVGRFKSEKKQNVNEEMYLELVMGKVELFLPTPAEIRTAAQWFQRPDEFLTTAQECVHADLEEEGVVEVNSSDQDTIRVTSHQTWKCHILTQEVQLNFLSNTEDVLCLRGNCTVTLEASNVPELFQTASYYYLTVVDVQLKECKVFFSGEREICIMVRPYAFHMIASREWSGESLAENHCVLCKYRIQLHSENELVLQFSQQVYHKLMELLLVYSPTDDSNGPERPVEKKEISFDGAEKSLLSTENKIEFSVIFEENIMGIQVTPAKDGTVMVRGFRKLATGERSWAERSGNILIGDVIQSVNATSLKNMEYKNAILCITNASRPLRLVFTRDKNADRATVTGLGESVVTEDLYEHERYFGALGWLSRFLPTDPITLGFSDRLGEEQYESLLEKQLPTDMHWKWKSQWSLVLQDENMDVDGWTYAFNFTAFESNTLMPKTSSKTSQSFVF